MSGEPKVMSVSSVEVGGTLARGGRTLGDSTTPESAPVLVKVDFN